MEDLRSLSYSYPSVVLDDRLMCDLELIVNGSFTPLEGFMNEEDYKSVLDTMHLKTENALFALPITLPVPDSLIEKVKAAGRITLKDKESFPIAVMDATSIWKPDLTEECVKAYGSDDDNHPYVSIVMGYKDSHYVGGKLHVITAPRHYDFLDIRRTPAETKELIQKNGWQTVLGFQTRNPMHRSHYELTLYALKQLGADAHLLLNPVVGVTQPVDVDYHSRVRCYKALMKYYPEGKATLSLLNLSMRMAGPREALQHALIRQAHGCTHFVIGRDHAGPSYKKKDGSLFYGPYDAQDLVAKYKDELKIQIITSQAIVYVKETASYHPMNEVAKDQTVLNISGTEQRDLLNKGLPIPEWFTYPEISEELKLEYKPLNRRGFALYFVGLSGSGKSTLAHAVHSKFLETLGHRTFTILDADEIRTNLSKGLGFSKEDRSTNVRRIGYAASLIVRHGGVAMIANIAPYKEDRTYNRKLIEQYGGYFEIFVDTKLEECEGRDCKGLYKAAREGKIASFTGISDPFEAPEKAEVTLDGAQPVEKSIEQVLTAIRAQGYID